MFISSLEEFAYFPLHGITMQQIAKDDVNASLDSCLLKSLGVVSVILLTRWRLWFFTKPRDPTCKGWISAFQPLEFAILTRH